MSEFSVNCPQCGAILAADDTLIGAKVECSYCKKAFVVPPKPVRDEQPKAIGTRIRCPQCGTGLDLPAEEEWIGRKIQCYECNSKFVVTPEMTVPFADTQESSVTPDPTSPPPSVQTPAPPSPQEEPAAPPQSSMPATPPPKEKPAAPPANPMPATPPPKEEPAALPANPMPATPPPKEKPAAKAPKLTLPRRSPPPSPQGGPSPRSTSAGPGNFRITDRTPPRPQGARSKITGSSFTFVCPECGKQTELPAGMLGKKYTCPGCCEDSIAEASDVKECPFCGKTIKFGATICKYCKRDLSEDPKEEKQGSKKTLIILISVLLLVIAAIGVFVYFGGSGSLGGGSGKIRVSVTVKYWITSSYESWKWGCEYKLYADGQLVATKESKSMSVSFDVDVPDNAKLTATMASRNGFGATELHEGPWLGTKKALYSGQSITIECR